MLLLGFDKGDSPSCIVHGLPIVLVKEDIDADALVDVDIDCCIGFFDGGSKSVQVLL